MSEWDQTKAAIRLFGLPWVLYARFIYRHHMRLIHRFGVHHYTRLGPLLPGGGYQDWCQWCGDRILYDREPKP